MWTAKLLETMNDPEGNPEVLGIKMLYSHTDGRKEEIIERISDFNSLKKIALDGVQAREQKDAREQAKQELLNNPPLGEIDLTPPEKTPEQTLQAKKNDIERKKKELDLFLDIKKITEQEYDSSVAELKNLLD